VEDAPIARVAEDFEMFFRSEYQAVLGLAISLNRNRSVAEEIVQDTFLIIFRDWARVSMMHSPSAWVRRIVVNRSISILRRSAAEAKVLLRMGSTSGHHEDPSVGDTVDIWREVRRLPRRQAQAIALTYVNDLSRAQVAEVLDCSPETVKTHLDRARRTLALRITR